MTYRATNDVVRRVMPLIERLADRSVEKARVLQYLSAQAGVDWGVHELVSDEQSLHDAGAGLRPVRELVYRDRFSGAEHTLRYPDALVALPDEIEQMVFEEYKRLAVDRPLTMMAEPLFAWFYADEVCAVCRWRGPEHEQVHLECRFAGNPINFEPDPEAP
ncbi:MAG: hypothetical protein WBA46_14715 [Thermomicrobiales bacterium]